MSPDNTQAEAATKTEQPQPNGRMTQEQIAAMLAYKDFRTEFFLDNGNHKLIVFHKGPPNFMGQIMQLNTPQGVRMVNMDHVVHCISGVIATNDPEEKRIIVP